MNLIICSVVVLGLIGFAGALLLYATARKFRVDEDPRIDRIVSVLPDANCGGCGLKGCRDFAARCVSQGSLKGLHCPVSTAENIEAIASVLGVAAEATERHIAVVRCNGSCDARQELYTYDGALTCSIMDATGVGTRGCAYGCLGCGDCVAVCKFGAINIDPTTKLPVIDPDKCTACGACVNECPRHIIELRPAGLRDRRVWVACSNRERGALARKTCTAACIACSKCVKACPFGAVTVSDNLSYINPDLCKTCSKCVTVCPTGAILSSFPVLNKTAVQS